MTGPAIGGEVGLVPEPRVAERTKAVRVNALRSIVVGPAASAIQVPFRPCSIGSAHAHLGPPFHPRRLSLLHHRRMDAGAETREGWVSVAGGRLDAAVDRRIPTTLDRNWIATGTRHGRRCLLPGGSACTDSRRRDDTGYHAIRKSRRANDDDERQTDHVYGDGGGCYRGGGARSCAGAGSELPQSPRGRRRCRWLAAG
jgi:hypothetical protein